VDILRIALLDQKAFAIGRVESGIVDLGAALRLERLRGGDHVHAISLERRYQRAERRHRPVDIGNAHFSEHFFGHRGAEPDRDIAFHIAVRHFIGGSDADAAAVLDLLQRRRRRRESRTPAGAGQVVFYAY
jgi:hypothetical protein